MDKDSVFKKTIDFQEAKALLEEMYQSFPTGFSQLDALCGGLAKNGVTLVAARPGMGNTSFVLNLVDRLAQQPGTILIISPTSMEELTLRLLRVGTGLSTKQFLAGHMPTEGLIPVLSAYYNNRPGRIVIRDDCFPRLDDIWEFCSQIPDLRLVVIDPGESICKPVDFSARSVVWEPPRENPETLFRSLQELAYTLQVPVLCTARLHRSLERRKNKRPRLTDLKKIGIPADLVDQVIFLHRDRYYDYQGEAGAEWIVAKSAQGGQGTVYLDWEPTTPRFLERKQEI